MWARLDPFGTPEVESVPGLAPGFWGLLATLGVPYLVTATPDLCLCPYLCPFLIRALVSGFRDLTKFRMTSFQEP